MSASAARPRPVTRWGDVKSSRAQPLRWMTLSPRLPAAAGATAVSGIAAGRFGAPPVDSKT